MVEYLTTEDLLFIAEGLGAGPVRDIGILHAAAARPQATVFGQDAYPDIHLKAAALMESIIKGHALVDGNKRTGFNAVVVFYELNGVELDIPDDDAYRLVIDTASSGIDLERIAQILAGASRELPGLEGGNDAN